nr:MAG TPA: hypothetical protein [Caudoviricetes sp.]
MAEQRECRRAESHSEGLPRFPGEKLKGYSLLKRECPPGPLKRNAGGFRFPPAPP